MFVFLFTHFLQALNGYIKLPFKTKKFTVKNIVRSQKAAQSASHRLLRCQVVLTKRLFHVLSEIELSAFEFLTFVLV